MPSPLAVSHLDLSECLLTDCGVTPIFSLVRAGASEINLADTIGAGVPTQVSERIEAIGAGR